MSELLVVIFLTIALVMLVFVLVLICRNLYEIFEEPAIVRRMKSLRKNKQPSVTVLLYARNNEQTIENSLKALVRNNYHNYDIVVINDRSKDKTLQVTKQYLYNNPIPNVQLVNQKKAKADKVTLQAAYKKSKRGEVVISLRATTTVSVDFIKRAVATKADTHFNTMCIDEPVFVNTLSEIIYSLNTLIWHKSKKITVSDAKHITPIKLEVNPEIMNSVILILIISVSIITNEAIIFWYCWLITTSYIFALILMNQQRVSLKFKLVFSAFPALFLLPISSLLQGYSQVNSRN